MGLRALIGSLIGLVASIGLIVWRRWLRNGVETSAEAQDVCGVMSLGSIPKVGSWWRRVSVADHVLAEPDGIVAERIRNVLYGVRFSHVRPRLKVVMVTSPLSQDGKSTLVAAMARVGAREGLRCLAVDCDFYRPSLARMIKVTPNVYLNEPQARTAKLADLVVADPASGAHFILAEPSSGRSDPLSLEGTPLGRIIEDARDIYDLVIIDTPPVLKVIDPLVLSQSADGTVLVLPYRTVSRKVIREVMQRLAVFTCPVIGVVLSRVEGQSFRSYGYRRYDLAKT
jgi:Mrp family chromosome partitioning ATPase